MNIKNQVANIQQSALTDPRFKHNEDVEVTPAAIQYIDSLFNSMLPHFPAWRQSCPTEEDLGRLKSAWAKAVVRHSRKVGHKLNVKAGLLACEESDTDWLPSVGKFIKWCEQSDSVTEFANRAYDLFINRSNQLDNIGQSVVSKHGFDLRSMKAADSKKEFIRYYLMYSENNNIEPLESNLLTETVQLSPEQQKEAEKRADEARNRFLNNFSGLLAGKKDKQVKKKAVGIKKGSTHAEIRKSIRALDRERERQLALIKNKLGDK